MIEEERTEYINKKNSKIVFIKKKFSFTVKKLKPMKEKRNMDIDSDEDTEVAKRLDEEMAKIPEIVAPIGESGFNIIDIKDDELLSKDQKALLGQKKKRVKKLKKLREGSAKVKVRQISDVQKLFNALSKKSSFTEDDVKTAARDINFKIDQTNVDFFVTLGQVRSNLRKFGIPGSLCKNPFHIFFKFQFYAQTQIVTNDVNAWNAYYWYFFTKNEKVEDLSNYSLLARNSEIKEFSFITDTSFQCKGLKSGYVQDYTKDATLITEKGLSPEEVIVYKDKLTKGEDSAIALKVVDIKGSNAYVLYQYKDLMIVAPANSNLEDILASTDKVKCVNTKNKLVTGLKEIKVDPNLGNYLNIHEFKTTGFSPSCIFLNPPVVNPLMFINADLEMNDVYNAISGNIEKFDNLSKIPLPPNAIFWDNLDSAVQLFAFIKLVHNTHETVSAQIAFIVQRYHEFKSNITTWKRLYGLFESVVLSFYDRITNKITIDSIRTLASKVERFIREYNDEKIQVNAYQTMIRISEYLPNTIFMRNFIQKTIPIDLMYALAKLISMINVGKLEDKQYSVFELFKAVGLSCYQVLFNGTVPMIPKIRSKCAFLGGLLYDTTNEKYKKNINYLIDSYKKSAAANLKLQGGSNLDINEMDELVKNVILNTLKNSNSEVLQDQDNAEAIINKVMTEADLLKSLRSNVEDLLLLNNINEIKANATFADDETFMTFLKTFNDIAEKVDQKQIEPEKVLQTVEVKVVGKPKEKKFRRRLGTENYKGSSKIDIKKVKTKKGAIGLKKRKKEKILDGIKERNKEANIEEISKKIEDVISKVNTIPEEENEEISA